MRNVELRVVEQVIVKHEGSLTSGVEHLHICPSAQSKGKALTETSDVNLLVVVAHSSAVALEALESVGLAPSGQVLALNSYENRVYQIGLEEGAPLVAKFYRPGRWTDAAILEEHAFVQELVEREIPVVPALVLEGKTLHSFEGFRFAVFPKHGGRAPELEGRSTLEWMGRFLGRIHAVGALKPFRERPTLDIASFGERPRDYLLAHGFIPADLDAAYRSAVDQALDGVRHCFARAGEVRALRLHGDCHVGNVLWTDVGPHFVDFDDSRMGPAVQDLWMLLSGDRADMVRQLLMFARGTQGERVLIQTSQIVKDLQEFGGGKLILRRRTV